MVRLSSVVVHVSDIDGAVDFWSSVLEGQFTLVHRDHNSATFHPCEGGIGIVLNANDQTHFDLDTGPWSGAEAHAAKVERLIELGAERVDWSHRPEVVVLADPSGLRFCVC